MRKPGPPGLRLLFTLCGGRKDGFGVNKKLYRALTALLAAALAVCAVVIVRSELDSRAGQRSYEEAARVAGLAPPPASRPAGGGDAAEEADAPEEDHLAALAEVDLAALREMNPEVVGWLDIPGTGISYPVVQGGDNRYYLRRTWLGESNTAGSIFMESSSSPDLTDFNTILYGHRMRSGTMFAPLQRYSDPDYFREHPSVYFVDGGGLHRYDVFAAHAVGVREIVYRLDLETPERQEEFIAFCLDRSVIDTGVAPAAGDRILTLSTCTGNGYSKRWVVQAVLREDAPPP